MFIYERGQCGSANDILALSSDQALMTIDIARGTIQLQYLVYGPYIGLLMLSRACILRGLGEQSPTFLKVGG